MMPPQVQVIELKGIGGRPRGSKDSKPRNKGRPGPGKGVPKFTPVKPPGWNQAWWDAFGWRQQHEAHHSYRINSTPDGVKVRRPCNRCQERGWDNCFIYRDPRESKQCGNCKRDRTACEGPMRCENTPSPEREVGTSIEGDFSSTCCLSLGSDVLDPPSPEPEVKIGVQGHSNHPWCLALGADVLIAGQAESTSKLISDDNGMSNADEGSKSWTLGQTIGSIPKHDQRAAR